jgi:hypothetical protein
MPTRSPRFSLNERNAAANLSAFFQEKNNSSKLDTNSKVYLTQHLTVRLSDILMDVNDSRNVPELLGRSLHCLSHRQTNQRLVTRTAHVTHFVFSLIHFIPVLMNKPKMNEVQCISRKFAFGTFEQPTGGVWRRARSIVCQ